MAAGLDDVALDVLVNRFGPSEVLSAVVSTGVGGAIHLAVADLVNEIHASREKLQGK